MLKFFNDQLFIVMPMTNVEIQTGEEQKEDFSLNLGFEFTFDMVQGEIL